MPEGARLRSLRLESESLGLIGVVDIVEGGPDGAEIIDYKKGSARRDGEGERVAKEPDAIQVAAHALLLREQGVNAVRGAIYYAADKRRVPVEFSEELFAKVRKAIEEARAVASSGSCPPPLKNDARCLYCSAYPICLPNESLWWAQAAQGNGRRTDNSCSDSPDNRRTPFATGFLRRWSSPPNPASSRPRWSRRDREATTARCWWCKHPARKSASAAISWWSA